MHWKLFQKMVNLMRQGLTQIGTVSWAIKRLRHSVQETFTIRTTYYTPRRHSCRKMYRPRTSQSKSTFSSRVQEEPNLSSKIAETTTTSNRLIIVIRGAWVEIPQEITRQRGHSLDQGQPVAKIKLWPKTQASVPSYKRYTTTLITINRSNGALQEGHSILKQARRCKNRPIKVCKLTWIWMAHSANYWRRESAKCQGMIQRRLVWTVITRLSRVIR